MNLQLVKKSVSWLLISALLLSLMTILATNNRVSAATLSQTLVRFDRMKINAATTGLVCAKPATVATEVDVQVTFPTGYTVSTTTSNWTVSTGTTTGWPSGASAWSGIGTATAASGQIVTFPSSDLSVGTLYCFNWTNTAALSVKSSATANNSGNVSTRASGPSVIDSGDFATASIADDQIAVSASVPQSFSFALSGNTDALGALSTGSITNSSPARTATVNTNAKNGWLVWAKDANTGLNSASAAYTINSTTPGTNSTISAGSEGYNMGVASSQVGGTGTISVAAAFVNGVGTGGGLDTTLRTLASSNGTADTAVLTMTNHVTIAATTPSATDYADTITVVGAGMF